MTAASAASRALKNTCAAHQPRRTTMMLGARATVKMPRLPPARPATIQGLPHGEEVRSLSLPKNGLANIDSSEPTLVTSASRLGAALMPTRSLTFNASETSSGARNSREVPV
jgi:hypothetical protein